MGSAANGAEGLIPVATPGISRFLEASDGIRLHHLRWVSEGDRPSAVVVFLHGIASHAAWFAETAIVLSAHGVAVYGPDRRGSGLSGGGRGHLARFELALSDVDEIPWSGR